MVQGEDSIQLLRPDGKRGILISKKQYDIYCQVIFEILGRENDHTINDILEEAKQRIDALESDIAWNVLQVKLDLEARGLIKIVSPVYHKKTFHIKLTRPGIQQIKNSRLYNKITP